MASDPRGAGRVEADGNVNLPLVGAVNVQGLAAKLYLTGTTSVVVRGLFDRIDYVDNFAERDGRGYGRLGGFVFSPRGDIQG